MKNFLAFVLISLLVFFSIIGFTQDKLLTLKDAVYLNPDVVPKKMDQLQWMGVSNDFTYVENDELLKCSALTDEKRAIVNLYDFNAAFEDMNVDSIKHFPKIT